jgi:hypothetical protein
MKKYVIFYYLAFGYDYVCANAESFKDAVAIAGSFSHKSGAIIIGVCPEFSLNHWCHE